MIWSIEHTNIYDALESECLENYFIDAEDGEYEVVFKTYDWNKLYGRSTKSTKNADELSYYKGFGVIVKDNKFIPSVTIKTIGNLVKETGYHGVFIEKIKLTDRKPTVLNSKGVFEVSIGS